ncbi:replicative DNA helicase loader DnaI [Desulfotomaculum arcticum]|uniref:Replicative DNA helicase loader DnaI n=1 Tax=Desulfotruncus arcticus DSM 17038 TaxID=1121424 RepID=A0A1I2S2T3_9FIRM|nr:ATP-binding protein [Desulfotruncus arcticus]SFG44386.1 replicative DNA helicase loader DnaI [Desulfotomaculum arcticum] [Desulfotruncus arcticus DSM 17038]
MVFCHKCNDSGLIVHDDFVEQCSCYTQRAITYKIIASQIPPKFQGYTFEKFNMGFYSKSCVDPGRNKSLRDIAASTLLAAKSFVNNMLINSPTEGLLLTGPVGSGKTFLACCIANELLSRNKKILFVVVPDLLDQIKATYGPNRSNTVTESDLLDTAREVPMLILDDLGAHNYTDWTRNKIFSIINYRLNYLLPTVITSNINLEDLEEHLGERTTSRIVQMCKPYRLLVDDDIRVQLATAGK